MRVLTFGALVIALLCPAPAIRAAQSASGGATVSGRVIDGGTQIPIAGARVMLNNAAPARGRPLGPFGPPPQAVTGEDGVYVFTGVAPGQYRFQVQKVGFVQPNPAQTPLLDVGTGQVAGPVLRLTKGAAISGRVLDARGDPLADMMVQALRRPTPTGARGRGRGMPALPTGQAGQTNDIGEFRITGLEAGDYYVAASPRPQIPLGQSSVSSGTTPITTYYPNSSEQTGAQVITVTAAQTIGGLDIMMMTARGFAISGVVVDEMNKPIAGAMVMAVPSAPTTVAGLALRGSSRTQADGTFTLGNVTPGSYRLTASIPVVFSSGGGTVVGGVASGVVVSGSGGIVSYSSSSGPGATVQVTVGDADIAGVTIVTRR